MSATERMSRVLVHLLPRSLRDEHGEDVVQLACDRRRHRHEPLWRLWPSLVGDALSSAVRLRLEEAVFPTRAVVSGFGLALSAFAILSGGFFIGLPVLAIVGFVVFRTPASPPTGARAPRWVPWTVVGAAFVVASFAVIATSEDEFTQTEWLAIIGLLVLGLWSLGTALVIAVDSHRASPTPA